MAFIPPIRKTSLTGQVRVRRTWWGKYVLQVEQATQYYHGTPPPTGRTTDAWLEKMWYGTTFDWCDAKRCDIDNLDLGSRPVNVNALFKTSVTAKS